MARLRVAVRKLPAGSGGWQGDDAVFRNGGLAIDYGAATVSVDGDEVHLTPMEYKIICLLAKNIGRVLTHSYILKEVWGSSYERDVYKRQE